MAVVDFFNIRLWPVLVRAACVGWVVAAAAWPAATKAAGATPELRRTPLGDATMAPSLKAAAAQDGIKLSFERTDDRAEPVIGDSVVAWVGTLDGDRNRQWLIQFRRATLTAKEQKQSDRKREQVKYLSWGPVIRFESVLEVLELWIAGPVEMDEPVADPVVPAETRRLRVGVPGDYLRLGLDQSALVDMHIGKFIRAARQANEDVGLGHIYAMERPIKPESMAYAKRVAERIGFTPEMARAWVGGSVALQAFYEAADHAKPLRSIADTAVARPSIGKLAKVVTGTRFKARLGNGQSQSVDPVHYGLPLVGDECFKLGFGMSFGDDPMVDGEMIVTRPSPPLDVAAGILALLAINPKDVTRMVHVIVVGSERGKPDAGPISLANAK